MIIERLYPEIANLFGDSANFKYLRESIPDAEFIETGLNETPAFLSRDVSLVYMGPMSEGHQLLALEHLRPYRDRLAQMIVGGVHFLMTGNSFELFGHSIEQNGEKHEALGLLDFSSRCDTGRRYNGFFLGDFDGIKLTAFNSRFSHSWPGGKCSGFANVLRGIGLNEGCNFEGVKKNNFIGTYLLGPLLVLNPLFTARLMEELGLPGAKPAFFEQSMEAYERRLGEFEDERRKLD